MKTFRKLIGGAISLAGAVVIVAQLPVIVPGA